MKTKKKPNVDALTPDLIKHLIEKGVIKIDKSKLEKIAGEYVGAQISGQLEALMSSDGCWCPDPPNGCRC